MQSSEMYITLGVFVLVAFILYLLTTRDRARIRYRAEIQKELIAKFSSQELGEFLNSEAGKLLIRGSKYEVGKPNPQGPKTAKEIVGLAISWGVLILAVGFGIFAIDGLTMGSSVLIAVGIAFELNAALGYFFSRKWGTWEPTVAANAARTNGS